MRKVPDKLGKAQENLSLCEALDRLLNKGAVIHGDITISVADIDLLYLGLRLLVTSIDTALRAGMSVPERLRERPEDATA